MGGTNSRKEQLISLVWNATGATEGVYILRYCQYSIYSSQPYCQANIKCDTPRHAPQIILTMQNMHDCVHATAYIILVYNLLPTMHACKHAEPNPPTNLSAMMTCDSQGYKVYIEWKVHKTVSYNQHTAEIM